MKLYLVRHAQSAPKDSDPDQSLTEIGLSEAERVAEYVTRHGNIKINTITHSGKLRARQTAEIFYEALSGVKAIAAVKDLDPMADPSGWADRLGLMEDDLMLVGHLPHLGKLASLLVCGDTVRDVVDFRNAVVVCLERNETGSWTVTWMLPPELV
ncbi:MAG: phosphohistidine phosphatase SixA [bacterium]|nr:phosphohistidine phosphatase SixA [bacterium]